MGRPCGAKFYRIPEDVYKDPTPFGSGGSRIVDINESVRVVDNCGPKDREHGGTTNASETSLVHRYQGAKNL